jgi:hypothetical protein
VPDVYLENSYRVIDTHGGSVIGRIALRRVGDHTCLRITDTDGREVYLPIEQMFALERITNP